LRIFGFGGGDCGKGRFRDPIRSSLCGAARRRTDRPRAGGGASGWLLRDRILRRVARKRAPHSPVVVAPLDDHASRPHAFFAGAPRARKVEGRSPVVTHEEGFNGLDRVVKSGTRQSVRSRGSVDLIGAAVTVLDGFALAHWIAFGCNPPISYRWPVCLSPSLLGRATSSAYFLFANPSLDLGGRDHSLYVFNDCANNGVSTAGPTTSFQRPCMDTAISY